jgi:hypothetical protein
MDANRPTAARPWASVRQTQHTMISFRTRLISLATDSASVFTAAAILTLRPSVACMTYRRYQSQHLGGEQMWGEKILQRLSPNTIELLQHAHYTYTKGICQVPLPTLDGDLTRDTSSLNFPKVTPKL